MPKEALILFLCIFLSPCDKEVGERALFSTLFITKLYKTYHRIKYKLFIGVGYIMTIICTVVAVILVYMGLQPYSTTAEVGDVKVYCSLLDNGSLRVKKIIV